MFRRAMVHLSRFLGLSLVACAIHVGCSSDNSSDAGVQDTGVAQDSGQVVEDSGTPDAGRPDSGPHDASEPLDAGYYCTLNHAVNVGGENVTVGDTSTESRAGGMRPAILCTNPVMGTFNDSIFIRGCASFVGTKPTDAEL